MRLLKHPAARCDYADMVEMMLRDQFLLGICDDYIRKKLLTKTKLTFTKAIEIAMVSEQVNQNIRDMKYQEGTNNQMNTIAVTKKNTRIKQQQGYSRSTPCLWCTYQHAFAKCRVYNDICKACKNREHYFRSKYCPLNKVNTIQKENTQQHNQSWNRNGLINYSIFY